jgi:hypothetical protein
MEWNDTLTILSIVAIDVVLFYLLRLWIVSRFEALTKTFPARSAQRGAVVKRFQSLRLNHMNFGLSFEIALDEEHAHFTPHRLARWVGALRFSVPREAFAEATKNFGGYRSAKLGRWKLTGPTWAFEPREPATSSLRRG